METNMFDVSTRRIAACQMLALMDAMSSKCIDDRYVKHALERMGTHVKLTFFLESSG